MPFYGRLIVYGVVIGIAWYLLQPPAPFAAHEVERDDKIYIVDRLGEKWDVTQAVSLGFEPRKFQYGIGRNAFTPLDDSHLTDDVGGLSMNTRVIGVARGKDARAYAVRKLARHEVANSIIGDEAMAVAY